MDFNGDGILDIIVGDREGFINYFRGTATATLTTEPDIQANSTTIDVGGNSAPVIVDWNEDGLLDMLVGNETGNVRVYLNSGSPTQHAFTTYTTLQSGGTNITHYRNCPQVYDLDQDGRKDLICGENGGKIYFYANTGTNEAPAFSGYEALESGGVDIDLYSGARLCVNDWDQDGLPDLVVSDYNGWVYLYLGIPTGVAEEESGVIAPETGLTVTGSPTTGQFGVTLRLGAGTEVAFRVYTADGRLAAESQKGFHTAGEHTFAFDLGGEPSGIYFVQAETGAELLTDRVVLLP